MSDKKCRGLLWTLAIVLLSGCVLGLYFSGFFEAARTRAGLEAYIQRCTPWSHLAFFFLQLASVIVAPIPSNLTAAAGAILFGLWPAFLITWAAVAAGSVIVFLLSRVLGQDFARSFVSQKLSDKYQDVIRRKRDVFLLLAFLFPFFPDDLLCILAGLTDISLKRFTVLVLAARPWGLLVACAVGSSSVQIPLWGMALLGLGGAVVFLAALRFGDDVERLIMDKLKK